MKRIFAGLVLCIFATGLPVNVSAEPPETKQIKLGFSEMSLIGVWRTAHMKSAYDEAKKRNIDFWGSDARMNRNRQIDRLRYFIERKVDVIAFTPVAFNGYEEVLREIKAAGIPVILLDWTVQTKDERLWTTMIGNDFAEEGKTAARWLAEYVKKKKNPHGEVLILELTGAPDQPYTIGIHSGFAGAAAGNAQWRFVENVDVVKYGGHKQTVLALLAESKKTGKKIDVIFAHSDTIALAAIDAIKDSGRKPGEDIIVVSINGSADGIMAIRRGELACSVEHTPYYGAQVIDTVEALVRGEAVPRIIPVRGRVIDETNAEDIDNEW